MEFQLMSARYWSDFKRILNDYPQIANEFKEVYKEQCVGMFLNVNKDILINRIIGREQLTWDVVSEAVRRLNSDTERFENGQDYVDYIIDTDDSEYTLQVVEDIIYNKQ